jgi:hypothetical protein
MTEEDFEYIRRWIVDGHYDNGDYMRIRRLLLILARTFRDGGYVEESAYEEDEE